MGLNSGVNGSLNRLKMLEFHELAGSHPQSVNAS
jgi:hypothetical protein